MSRMLRTALIAASIALGASAAHADMTWTGAQVTQQSSGLLTGSSQMERQLGDRVGVTGIQMREHQDDPIYIQILGNLLCVGVTGDCDSASGREFRLRDGRSGNIASSRDINVGSGRYVTGLQVCTNGQEGNRAKIKGLRLWGGEITANGNVVTSGGRVAFERPNCRSWSRRVNCPSNQIMVGLRVYYGSRNGASAFRPVCARVDQASLPDQGTIGGSGDPIIIQRN